MAVREEIDRRFWHPWAPPHDADGILRKAIRAGADERAFMSPTSTVEWFRDQPEEVQNRLILWGVSSVIGNVRQEALRLASPIQVAQHRERQRERKAVQAVRARAGLRIIEMLDLQKIGDKALGDCTRDDLLHEAALLEAEAGELLLDARLYRELADLIGNQTVRAFDARTHVIQALTRRWGE